MYNFSILNIADVYSADNVSQIVNLKTIKRSLTA